MGDFSFNKSWSTTGDKYITDTISTMFIIQEIFDILELIIETWNKWVVSTMLSVDLRSPKVIASCGFSFFFVSILVLLLAIGLIWNPSLWPTKLKKTKLDQGYVSSLGSYEVVQSRDASLERQANKGKLAINFLPETQELNVYDDHVESGTLSRLPEFQRKKRTDGGDDGANDAEALVSVNRAIQMRRAGKFEKALKLFQHAMALNPSHPDVLTHYGEFLEHQNDIIRADHMYTRALMVSPDHSKALSNRQRTLPLVDELDQKQLSRIDRKRDHLIRIPDNDPALRRMKKEAYFQHIYHTVAIEGNTMTLAETRMVVETRMAVPGRSIIEHNEILGLEAALKYVNNTLVSKLGDITVGDILQLHKRVLGHVDPVEAGSFRRTQVFVGEHRPPSAYEIMDLMEDFMEWINSPEALKMHPVKHAALAHYKLVFIHPFIDGNGRTARLLMNLILMRAGYPPVIIRKQDRYLYYEYLQLANEGDVRPFIRFIAECTERTLDVYLYATEHSSGSLKALEGHDNIRYGKIIEG